jgi:hypothetical protein
VESEECCFDGQWQLPKIPMTPLIQIGQMEHRKEIEVLKMEKGMSPFVIWKSLVTLQALGK